MITSSHHKCLLKELTDQQKRREKALLAEGKLHIINTLHRLYDRGSGGVSFFFLLYTSPFVHCGLKCISLTIGFTLSKFAARPSFKYIREFFIFFTF